ncbi:dTDP-3-amino-3,6-dideoxy-alpha-D-glucopyranose N,N-dimethyltransferase [Phycisphaerae bacterium RAS1]|nr:dTDP-3-amino-3,6-dideoxy-alpha-D-glucopyranose N,N-dimethyltransferase [Phycisphaerae bacterium RAS1]
MLDESRHVVPEGDATEIPAEVYDVGFGWDPLPEVHRLLFAARQAGVEPASALELGCGSGRILRALAGHIADRAGLDLSPTMVDYAAAHADGAAVHCLDMSAFELGRRFDLIYASANSLRCVTDAAAVLRLWRRIAAHLAPGGVFVADLELGLADEGAKLNKPATWAVSRSDVEVRVSWTVTTAPDASTRCCRITWRFERREADGPPHAWSETFSLRTYDAAELAAWMAAGGLAVRAFYEIRDPYLLERPVERAVGRMLVVAQSA